MIRTNNLTTGYLKGKSSRSITDTLELELGRGVLAAVCGPNGAGKTTLLKTLSGLLPSLEGSVEIDETDISSFSPGDLARHCAVVLTDIRTLPYQDVYSFISLGRNPWSGMLGKLSELDHKRIEENISLLGLEKLRNYPLPEISDGEKQRAVLARALVQDTDTILLDEPTARLDTLRSREFISTLRELCHLKKLTILFSSHDLELAVSFADRLLLLGDNKWHFDLPEALGFKGAFEDTYEAQKGSFNPVTGVFTTSREPLLPVLGIGPDKARPWLDRLLHKYGFTFIASENLSSNPSSAEIKWNDNLSGEFLIKMEKTSSPAAFTGFDQLALILMDARKIIKETN